MLGHSFKGHALAMFLVWFLVKYGLLFGHLKVSLLIGIENQMWFGF